jgi:hypothetical protein
MVFHPSSLSISVHIHLLSRPPHKFKLPNNYFRDARICKLRWRNVNFRLVYDKSTGQPAIRSTWQQASITYEKTQHKLRDQLTATFNKQFLLLHETEQLPTFCHSVRCHIIYVCIRKHDTQCAWLCVLCKVWCNHKSTGYMASHTT